MKNGISTILFDLGGVVLNLDYNRTVDAFKKMGGEGFEVLYSQAQQDKGFDHFETGQWTPTEFRNYVRSYLGNGHSDDEIDEAWNAMLLDLPAERITLLLELKKHYSICLFSNTNAIHLKRFREIIGAAYGNELLLESVFHKTYYSHEIKLRKPHKEAFQHILTDQNLRADEVLFIDDSLQHIEGARGLGIKAEHLVNQDVRTLCEGLL